MPFFSVVIPIHNVCKFIEAGIDCLLNQNFSDFEIILVDDGSTDSSPELCDRQAAKNPRIKVFHTVNHGSGPARNKGIEEASGKYVTFFDIDDFLHHDALATIHKIITDADNPEMVIFSYKEIDYSTKRECDYIFATNHFRNNQQLRDNFVKELSGVRFNNGFVWNKAYRKDFLIDKGIRFEPLLIQQDEVFNHAAYKEVSDVVVSDTILYDYFVYSSGNTRSRFIPERFDIYLRVRQSFMELSDFWQLNDDRLNHYIHKRFIDSVLVHLDSLYRNAGSAISKSGWRDEIQRLSSHPAISQSIGYLNSKKPHPESFHFYIAMKALSCGSTTLYSVLQTFDSTKKKLKNLIKSILLR